MSADVERRHGEGCACTRCTGFQPGHTLSVRHGAYASLQLAPLATEHAEEIRRLVPMYSESDEPSIRLLAIAMARIDRAAAALEQVDEVSETNPLGAYIGELGDRIRELRRDERGWVNTAARLADALGLTPTSRAKLGLDVVRTSDSLAQLAATGAEIRARRSGDV